MTDIRKIASDIIREEVEKAGYSIVKIVLFGSRAKEQAHPDSDWDFYVVVDREMGRETKWDIIIKIKRRLARLKIPNDVIINSLSQAEQRKGNVGYITYYALREGTTL